MKPASAHSSWLARLDYVVFALLLVFLVSVVWGSGMANIQTDAIDYYAIVQRLTGDTIPILPHLPFVAQRSPGYPLLTLPTYSVLKFTTFWITPEIVQVAPPPVSVETLASERALLPPQPLLFREIFFKNFDLAPQGGWFRWNIIAAMLITGYGLFFAGLIVSGRTLALLYPPPVGVSLPLGMVISSMVFMHNLVNTPAYATLTVFGISSLFTYFWTRGGQNGAARVQWAAGLFAGLLVLTRLETVLIVAVLLGGLVWQRQTNFTRYFILGGLAPLALLWVYNATQFGNPFHADILKGDMNQIAFDLSYVAAVLGGPHSGILWWSALASLGIVGLFLSPSRSLKTLGGASLVLILLIAVRVPVMYFCVGQGTQMVSGLSITCPPDNSAMLTLIRFDANRYMIPLFPFAALGLRSLAAQFLSGRNFGKRGVEYVSE